MAKRTFLAGLAIGLWLAGVVWLYPPTEVIAQQAATVTPEGGPRIEVFQDVNVRAGPGTDYDWIGSMIKGQSGAILGQAVRGPYVWIRIVYIGGPDNEGWVLKDLVRVVGDLNAVPTVVPPPTPTVAPTSTPGAEVSEGSATPGLNVTRLPTFTAPPPVVRPTLLPVQGIRAGSRVPPALIIISLFVLGAFGVLVSLLRGR